MVFVIDDLLEGGIATAIITAISTAILGSSEASAGIVMAETVGGEGMEAIVSFIEGESVVTYAPRGVAPLVDELTGEEISLFDQINIPVEDKPKFTELVTKVASSLAKKVPRDSQGFKDMLKDIINVVINNKGKIALGGATLIGGVSAIDQLRKAYNNGKKLPTDVDDIYEDISKTTSDGKKLISDITPKIDN